MPVLSQADSVNIAVDHADLIVAPGSVLAGSLTIDGVGTLHIDSNLGLTSNGIVAVGAGGGIVAVGAGAGIVASGAGGGIVAVGAGGGIISSGGGGQIIAAGAGGMIIASGAGGQIVGNNGNAIVASGAGGGLFGNGEFGNPSLSVALSLDAASQLSIGHSPGSLTVHGSVSLAPTSYSRFEIGGLLREAEYDALDVVQVAGLGGTINLGGSALLVELYDGFESDPALANASFDLIETEGPINGAFSNLSSGRIATADGLGTFSISIGAHAVTLSNFLAATLPGDFNADSVVDARDYVVWRNQLHTAYSHSAYETWRAHFGAVGNGSSSGAVAVVPEPVSLILPLMLLIAITGSRRRALA
jgi:hypothetical protein